MIKYIFVFFFLANLEKTTKNKPIVFGDYKRDGFFIKTDIHFFDKNLKIIGNLHLKKIELVKILAKSRSMYNISQCTDNCWKSYFVRIMYKNTDYIVFGKDIFEIDTKQKFDFVNSNNEKFSLFSIKNFEIGASDEDGITGCEDFSILLLSNEKTKKYSTIEFPQNEINKTKSKYAILTHDNFEEEKIYKVSVSKNNIIVVGIKAKYQEGGGTYDLRIHSDKNKYKSKITDKFSFEENEIKTKLDSLK